jgi:hypothetical protein
MSPQPELPQRFADPVVGPKPELPSPFAEPLAYCHSSPTVWVSGEPVLTTRLLPAVRSADPEELGRAVRVVGALNSSSVRTLA